MFQIELLSGGVFWVYAVYPQMSAFLIWKDDHWIWMAITGFGWRLISVNRMSSRGQLLPSITFRPQTLCRLCGARRKADAGLLFYMQKSGIQKELRLSVSVLEAQGRTVLGEGI